MTSVVFTLEPLGPGAGPLLRRRMTELLASRPDAVAVICDVSALERPTPTDLDHLARLRLTARRADRAFVLRGVGPRLRLLLTLTGLAETFGTDAPRTDAPGTDASAPGGAGGQPHGQVP